MQVKTKNGSSPDVRVRGWAPSVGTLWRSVGVRDSQRLSIGRALAKTASIAGGFKSWGDNSRPAWVSLGEGWGKEAGLSITLAKPHTAVGNTSGVSVDSGSNTISITQSVSQGLSRPLAISALWGSVAVGDSSWVSGNTRSPNRSPWLSRPLSVSALWGPVAVGDSSWVGSNAWSPYRSP